MARYRSRKQPFHVQHPLSQELLLNDREDSGVQLDEPSSPVSKQMDEELSDVVRQLCSPRHGVTVTKMTKAATHTTSTPPLSHSHVTYDSPSIRRSHRSCEIGDVVNRTVDLKVCDVPKSQSAHSRFYISGSSIERSEKRVPCGCKEKSEQFTQNIDEDEGLDIRDSNCDLHKGDNQCSKLDYESENSDTEHVNFYLKNKSDENLDNATKQTKTKETKKRRFRKFLGGSREIRRSQSLGCATDLSVPEHALFLQYNPNQSQKSQGQESPDTPRRMIHKTCSADAAMMASEVLPLDPGEMVRTKQKTSIAKNVRRKLQKLRRRNTDSLLGATIMSMRGATKVTVNDALEWGKSFEALLRDKNGLELFKNFLRSEFSEENIEFWIACEEFKTIRTNKLVSRAQKIYTDYIAIKAPKQVNLDSKTRLDTVTNLEHPTRDAFTQAQKRIQFLMENDSYKRFLETDTYKNLIHTSPGSGSR